MQTTRRWIMAAWLVVAAGVAPLPALQSKGDSKPQRIQPAETQALRGLVDQLAAGQPGGGDAWLQWECHFLKGPDAKAYIPFTLTIDEAPNAFDRVAFYLRVLSPEAKAEEDVGFQGVSQPGETPVNVPERQFHRGEPTAGEASAVLRGLSADLKRTKRVPFEEVYTAERAPDATMPHRIQRALSLAPGRYMLYLAVRERGNGKTGELPKTAMLKRDLIVPDFSVPGLMTSSVILAERVEPLISPLSKKEQVERPYALGTAELVPSPTTRLRSSQPLSLAFFVYNTAVDTTGKPDVTVEYRMYQDSGGIEKLLGSAQPQVFNSGTLPPGFSLKAGHQIVPMQSFSLQNLAPGPYRLRIRVTDNVTNQQVVHELPFTVVGGA